MDRLQDNAREHWDWEKNPIRVYTPDPEELKEWQQNLPFKLEDVFDFNSGLREGDMPEPRPPPPPKCDQLDEIEKAASEGDLSTIQRIFDQLRGTPADDYWISLQTSSLFRAVRTRHTAVVEYFLSQGSSPTVGLAKIAADNNDTAMLELFLKYRWDINEQLGWCDPPVLGFVVENVDLVTWFLSHGADPNARCVLDITPLSYAVRSATFDIIKIFFAHGGSIYKGQLLHFATRRKLPDRLEIVTYLVGKGAPINEVMYQHDQPSTDLQSVAGLGTPLHGAAADGHLDVVRFLVDKGADLSIFDSCGKSVLHCAEFHKRQEVVDFLRHILAESSNPPASTESMEEQAA